MPLPATVDRQEDGYSRPPASPDVVAWKCENCRKWLPPDQPSIVILVDDVGAVRSSSSGVRAAARFIRRMVVDAACARQIGGS